MRRRRSTTVAIVSSLLVAACASEAASDGAAGDTAADGAAPVIGAERVDLLPTGNRVALGRGRLGVFEPTVIEVPGTPIWILPSGETWIVTLDDGRVLSIDATSSTVSDADTDVIATTPIDPDLLSGLVDQATPLPDARVVADENGLAAILASPTDRYAHGVLGDRLEASTIEVVGGGVERIEVTAPDVIEGLAPILADIDGDGVSEILVTVSNADTGARLVAYKSDGTVAAEAAAIGRGNRWRNQMAVAATGPNGETEVVDVRTPHLTGTVEWFQFDGDELVRVAALDGYTSHVLGSRNLDMGIVADADGNGSLDVVIPTFARDQLGILTRNDDVDGGAQVAMLVELGGQLTTNISAIERDPQRLTLAVGTTNNQIYIWPG